MTQPYCILHCARCAMLDLAYCILHFASYALHLDCNARNAGCILRGASSTVYIAGGIPSFCPGPARPPTTPCGKKEIWYVFLAGAQRDFSVFTMHRLYFLQEILCTIYILYSFANTIFFCEKHSFFAKRIIFSKEIGFALKCISLQRI